MSHFIHINHIGEFAVERFRILQNQKQNKILPSKDTEI